MPSYKLSPRLKAISSWAVLALSLFGVYSTALIIRRDVLQTQINAVRPALPFTLESALHYRRVKMLFDRGQLPEIDEAIQFPEGIRIREIDAVSSEPVVAFLAKLFPDVVPFPERIRWIESGWFCLSIPLLAWSIRLWTGSWFPGFLASLFYAVSIASVLRTTGQEISRENFAIPWLMLTFALASGYHHHPRKSTLWLILFGFSAAMTLISWDMMQYMLGLSAMGMTIHLLSKKADIDQRVMRLFQVLVVSVGVVGIFHPYHRYHGLLFSPLYIWLLALWAAAVYRSRLQVEPHREQASAVRLAVWFRKPIVRTICIIFGPPLLMMLIGLTSSYAQSYGHFGELLIGKLRYLNVKPEDPALLTYYQRIMWVPSLDSATWELTKWLFPYSLWLTGAFGIAAWLISRHRLDPFIRYWLLVLAVSLAAYVLFVRFHVFVILAMAMVLGWMCSRVAVSSKFVRIILMIMVLSVTIAEGMHTSRERSNMGRPNVYYQELADLAEWLKEQVSPEPVLANMGVSAYIAAYGKCPIVIHPKFEDPSIRRRLEKYGQLLFGSNERELRNWMDELGVEYFVYSKGEFAAEKPEYQMRYFVNMLNPPDDAPARRFERDDDTLHYFQRLWGNRKYVIYRTLTGSREAEATKLAEQAQIHLAAGHLPDAEHAAMEAIAIDRSNETALKVLRHVGSLMDQKIHYEPGAVAP